jgi:hypothetical protein
MTVPYDTQNSFSETNLLVLEGEISQVAMSGIE